LIIKPIRKLVLPPWSHPPQPRLAHRTFRLWGHAHCKHL
jgi:hypothetical protein